MKKMFVPALAAAFLLAMTGCAQQEVKHLPEDDIYIFYTSDVHNGVDENLGFASLKAMVSETKAEHEGVLLVDAGDYLQGGTLGSLSAGELIVDLMNTMEYDIATIGNHEFDYGMYQLADLMQKAEFDIVACNVTYNGKNTNVFEGIPPYVIKEVCGVKIAFLGIITPSSISQSTPAYFMEDNEIVYDFYSGNDGQNLWNQVQKTADEARKEGADYVIAISHLGSTIYQEPYDSVSVISHTTGIDAFIDGHSHSVIIGDLYPNADGEDVLLTSCGTKMQNAGEVIIAKDGTISSLLVSEYDKQDEEIVKAVDDANAKLEDILSEEVGTVDFDLKVNDKNGLRIVRCRESTMADYCTDAVRYVMGTDVAILNGGGIRHDLESGTVTYGKLLDVMPFQNTIGASRCSGQQILDVLEFGVRKTESISSLDGEPVGESGGFMQVSGLKYTVDTSIPSCVVTDENGMLVSMEGERRVRDVYVLVNDEYVPLDPEGEYTISSISYVLFSGGDGNTVLQDCEVIAETGMTDVECLIEYTKYLETIPDTYAAVQGRITVK